MNRLLVAGIVLAVAVVGAAYYLGRYSVLTLSENEETMEWEYNGKKGKMITHRRIR